MAQKNAPLEPNNISSWKPLSWLLKSVESRPRTIMDATKTRRRVMPTRNWFVLLASVANIWMSSQSRQFWISPHVKSTKDHYLNEGPIWTAGNTIVIRSTNAVEMHPYSTSISYCTCSSLEPSAHWFPARLLFVRAQSYWGIHVYHKKKLLSTSEMVRHGNNSVVWTTACKHVSKKMTQPS